MTAFSEAVFAVIVTIMVLELKAPDQPGFPALRPLGPTVISYAVSYLFIAIIWINHDYLMRLAHLLDRGADALQALANPELLIVRWNDEGKHSGGPIKNLPSKLLRGPFHERT